MSRPPRCSRSASATEGTAEGAEGNRRSLQRDPASGALAAAGFSLLAALKVVGNEVSAAFRVGSGGTLFGASLSLALIGVGHLVGVTVGAAMIVGLLISYGILLPTLTWGDLPADADVSDVVSTTFGTEVRFVGAGAIAVAAVWTLLKILGPIVRGIRAAAVSSRARRGGGTVDLTERDLPIGIVGGTIAAVADPDQPRCCGASCPTHPSRREHRADDRGQPDLRGGDRCGDRGRRRLHGRAHRLVEQPDLRGGHPGRAGHRPAAGRAARAQRRPERSTTALVAYSLFTTAVVFSVATISNDNLQDLKTGQLVGATPWKQQVALVIGVVFGALVIAPVLDLLNAAFGFAGAPGAGDDALAAPQAALISALAEGVFGGDLNWGLIGLGALIGAVVIVIDEVLARTGRLRLPPLAVGMGMYLPMSLTLLIPIGALLGRCVRPVGGAAGWRRRVQEAARRADGHRAHRRREPVRGDLRRDRGRLRDPTLRWPSSGRASRTGPSCSASCCTWRWCSRCTGRPAARPTTRTPDRGARVRHAGRHGASNRRLDAARPPP